MDTPYHLQWELLCSQLGLGALLHEPQEISGGLLHKMFSIRTERGSYAAKALNPQIMLRPMAMQNYLHSEQIAQLVSKNVPALPAKIFQGKTVQTLKGQYYLIFDWLPHKALTQDNIQITHCQQIGEILAHIHNTDFSSLHLIPDSVDTSNPVDWHNYLQQGIQENAIWINEMQECAQYLYTWDHQRLNSATLLPLNVISHRDLDPKNTLWENDKPVIIDWEAAGWINSTVDLLETALYWSTNVTGDIDQHKLNIFIHAYQHIRPDTTTDWTTALQQGTSNKLDWLEYNLKRTLGKESNTETERTLGNTQVTQSLKELKQYAEMMHPLAHYLQETRL